MFENPHVSNLLLIGITSLLGAMSPGPDFLIVVRNSLVYSRKMGFLTALGVALALIVHLTYTLASISFLIEFTTLFTYLKYIGAFYLFYIGLTGLKLSILVRKKEKALKKRYDNPIISSWTALRQGFLTNLLNPTSAIFFISLFSQFISSETTISIRLEYALLIWCVSMGWLSLLAYLITAKFFQPKVDHFRHHIDGLMGSFLMLVGLKMLFV